MAGYTPEPMMDMYLFETAQLIEQLEQIVICSEKSGGFSPLDTNEIFRVMHTIKGASAMMVFDNVAQIAHSIEDVFFFIREAKPENVDCSKLSDLILDGADFIKIELEKIRDGSKADGDSSLLHEATQRFLEGLRQANPDVVKLAKPITQPAKKQQYFISRDTPPACKKSYYQATVYFRRWL